MAINDLTRRTGGDDAGFINIDDVLDVFNGVKESIKEETNVDQSNTDCSTKQCSECTSKTCDSNKESKEKKPVSWDNLVYDYDPDDEDDDCYICEYCTKIGKSEKYDTDVCDECNECEQCREFGEECDGCSYSCHRDGSYYKDKLDTSDLVSVIDMELIERAESINTDRDYEIRGGDDTRFTILDI